MNQEIETKKCPKCQDIKPINQFHKHNQTKDGYKCYCKICRKLEKREHYLKNRERLIQRYKLHKDIINKKRREKYWLNPELSREKGRTSHQQHPEYRKKWEQRNPNYYNNHYKKRRTIDPTFKYLHNMRIRMTDALKGNYKSGSTLELMSYNSSEEFRQDMNSLFLEGMTENNYGNKTGQWSIDHITPCDAFDLTDPAEQKRCFHRSNLRPMWHIDNIKKGNKTEGMKLLYRNNTNFINI